MRKIFAAFLPVVFFGAPLCAGSAGTTAVPFLELGAGARGLAMGGAYGALAGGSDALFWNPAGLARQNNVDASLNHQSLLKFLNYDGGSIAWPGTSSGFAAGSAQLKSDSIDALDESGASIGNFDTKDQVLTAGFGHRFHGWSGGASAEWIRSSLANVSASAWALGFGVNAPAYAGGRLQHGFIVQNWGSKIRYDQAADSLPFRATFATVYRPISAWRVTADLVDSKSGLNWAAGTEYEIPLLENRWSAFLRAGYTSTRRDLGSGLSVGGGLNIRQLRLDFAWIPENDFGSSDVFTLGYRFGERAKPAGPPAPEKKPADAPVKEFVPPTVEPVAPPVRPEFGTSTKASTVHVVKDGDTLEKLAQFYYGNKELWTIIYAANKALIRDPTHLSAGQKLLIPPAN
jgi:hypothetical protein